MVSNIPLALLGSLFGLWLTGNTINIMSLGGMALAIGILVDMLTVTVENVHVQMQHTDNIASAVLHGSLITAVPILLALLCILSVFVPAFIMGDPLRSLFMPLTLAVGFAMISSYLLSSTFVPIMCVGLLKHMGHHDEEAGIFGRLLKGYRKVVGWFVHSRWLLVPAYVVACALLIGGLGLQIGTELFPQVRLGPVRAPVPAPAGLELRVDPADGGEVPGGDRARGEAREHPDLDGLRGPGGAQLRHRQHGPVHARARRWLAARRIPRQRRDQARRVPRAAALRGPAQAGDPLAGGAVGEGRLVQARGPEAGQAGELRLPARRHRHQRHELRLLDTDRRPRRRHGPEYGSAAGGEDRRQHEAHPLPPRR